MLCIILLFSGFSRANNGQGGGSMDAKQRGTKTALDEIIRKYKGKPGELLGILEEEQNADPKRYLSEETLRLVSEGTGTSLSGVYSVATFYSFFNLKPQGEHTIFVCRGTACHTRGSLALLEEAVARLGVTDFREDEEPSFTTPDAKFTVKTVACFGQCALAPVVSVDGHIYSRMTTGALAACIAKLAKIGKGAKK
jgi:NADH-quinone oxidoreductase subunit E